VAVSTGTARVRRDPGRVLWVVTGAAWLLMLGMAAAPAVMAGMPAMAASMLGAGGISPGPVLAVFVGGWIVMVAAMMVPTTVPMARLVTRLGAPRAPFYAAYVAVWVAAGLLGLGLATAVSRLTVGVPSSYVLAGALAIAGAAQFSPVTRRCLTVCRDPHAFLFARYRRGPGGAWSLGLRHAVFCVGCCWALMLLMFATGVASLLWMLVLTAVMVAEKAAPWGHRLVVPVGGALLLVALLVALAGALSAGTTTAPMPMPM
jgi:predicted metal-binding membrane protein